MNRIEATGLFAEMQRMASQASAGATAIAGEGPQDFGQMLQTMVDSVNEAQQAATAMATDFSLERGQGDLAEVMVAMQRARVHFETMVQVRNRLVQAYQDIMRMPM
jgi:flagellar hook-basal body complex protein FliE